MKTFGTPQGHYLWLHLCFELAANSEIFQKRLQLALERLSEVTCVTDNIPVFGVGETEKEAVKDHD